LGLSTVETSGGGTTFWIVGLVGLGERESDNPLKERVGDKDDDTGEETD